MGTLWSNCYQRGCSTSSWILSNWPRLVLKTKRSSSFWEIALPSQLQRSWELCPKASRTWHIMLCKMTLKWSTSMPLLAAFAYIGAIDWHVYHAYWLVWHKQQKEALMPKRLHQSVASFGHLRKRVVILLCIGIAKNISCTKLKK